jgi:1,2-phenylacetyl-CoA epoxidase PaaB subunit
MLFCVLGWSRLPEGNSNVNGARLKTLSAWTLREIYCRRTSSGRHECLVGPLPLAERRRALVTFGRSVFARSAEAISVTAVSNRLGRQSIADALYDHHHWATQCPVWEG